MKFKFFLPIENLLKSRAVQYIRKIPNPNYKGKGDNKFKYFYAKDFKNPLKSLLDFFGIKKDRVENAYTDEKINTTYGVDKDTWNSHVLEYFFNRKKWDGIFAIKENREKYKKPILQKNVVNTKDAKIGDTTGGQLDLFSKPSEKKDVSKTINRSLMRKVWTVFSAEGKQVAQSEKDEKVIEKKIINKIDDNKKEKITVLPEEYKAAKLVVPDSEYKTMLEYSKKGEEKEFYLNKIKEVAAIAHRMVENGANQSSYNEETEQHDKGYMHYFDGSSDWYICELNGDEAFGYSILNGDIQNSEFGYINMVELAKNGALELDLYSDQRKTLEQAVCDKFPSLKGELLSTAEEYNQMAEESEAEEHANRSAAMMGNDNAKKNTLDVTENQTNNVNVGESENDNNIESGRIPSSYTDLRGERSGSGSGNGKGNGGKSGERDSIVLDSSEPGERLGQRQKGVDTTGDLGRKLTKKEILKIREECEKLLASKKDDEFTEADKALLRQYSGAGGTNLEGASNAEILNEYYTPYKVINKVWDLVDKYNPNQNKTVLEPSAGIGRFAEGRSEKFTMCELSETTSRINKILHPDAEIIQGEFQKNFMENGKFAGKDAPKFDVVIGNPPYGAYSGRAKGKGEGKHHSKIEEYFIERSLDTLKDGGILAMVVPSSILRGADTKTKKILESKGELLEAWRLPNGTFDTTDVGTDIIIMRKGKGKPGSLSNDNYFKENPDCILGDVTEVPDWRNKNKMIPFVTANKDIDATLDSINLNRVAIDQKEFKKPLTVIEKSPKKSESEKHKNRSDAMKGNQNAKGEHDYPSSAGYIMDATEFSKKYSGREIEPMEMEVWKFTDYTGKIDSTKLSEEQILYIEKSDKYVKAEDGKYENVVTYASGNIREKLNSLDRNDPQYAKKKAILESVMPKEKTIEEIYLNPLDAYARNFTVNTEEGDKGYNYRGERVKGLIAEFFKWAKLGMANSPVSKYEIPEDIKESDVIDYIMGNQLRTERANRWEDPKVKAHENMKRKNLRAKTAQTLFNRFLREGLDPDVQERLVSEWNEKFNATVNPDYSQMPVFVEGMSTHKGSKEFSMLEQQIKGVSFLASKGSGLLAYDVGVGKTVTGIVATVNQLQTGKSKRPLICVPAAVYKKWIKEIKQHFPEQEIVELSNLRDMKEPDYSRFKDGAIHVCTYEALDVIGFTEETENELYEDVEFATDNPFKKENKRQKAQSSEKTDEMVGQMTKTTGKVKYLFEEMGIDHITVDEIHNFNHVFASPRVYEKNDKDDSMGNANEYSGMGGAVSAAGQKMFAVTQYIQKHNDNRNVFGLSATPFTNKPAEVYSILSLIARKRMKELGIDNLQEFMRKFADVTLEYVVKGNNSVTQENVMKGFNNLNVLQSFIREYIDKVDGEEAKVIRPHKRTITPMLEKNDIQEQIINYELERMANVSKKDPAAAIVAMNNMRQALLSPSFINEELKKEYADKLGISLDSLSGTKCVENSPKLKFVCDSIIKQYKTNTKNSQFMYVPRGVEMHKYIKEYLVKNGIPEDAVALMGDETGTAEKKLAKKKEKVDDFNNPDGKLKVIIGNESTKEGVSLNGNATTVYNCMLGWNPTEATQVEGRVWRQGNRQGVTSIVYPLIYDSLDARLYQLYEEKKGRIDSIFSYKGDSLNVEDIKADEMKFALIRDPKVKAEMQVQKDMEEYKSEMRSIDSKRDLLHDQKGIFEPLENNYDYKRYKDSAEEYTRGAEKRKSELEEGKKLAKKLSSKNEDERDLAEYKLRNLLGISPGRAINKESINTILEDAKSDYEKYKKTAASYSKEVRNMEYQKKKQLDALEEMGIRSVSDIDAKIESMSVRKMKIEKQLAGLGEKQIQLERQYRDDLLKERAKMPSVEDQVNTTVNTIVSTLKPMDEIKSWIKEMRSQGMSTEQIRDEVEERVTKSVSFYLPVSIKKKKHLTKSIGNVEFYLPIGV